MMQMTFYNSIHVTLWLESIRSSTWEGYLCLIVLVGWFGFLHEGLYAFRLACMTARSQAINDECVSVHDSAASSQRRCMTSLCSSCPNWTTRTEREKKIGFGLEEPCCMDCGFPSSFVLCCWFVD
jgi:hypothetical protein